MRSMVLLLALPGDALQIRPRGARATFRARASPEDLLEEAAALRAEAASAEAFLPARASPVATATAADGSPGTRLRRIAGSGAEARPGNRFRVRAVGCEPEIYADADADAAYKAYARLSDAGLAPYVDVLGPPPTAENAPTRELEVLRSLPLAGLFLDEERLDFRFGFLAVANAVLIVGTVAAIQAPRPESAAAFLQP